MIRSLIALFLAFAIAISGITLPAYAASSNPDFINNYPKNEESGNGYIDDSLLFVGEGVKNATQGLIGATILCYTLNAVATTVFPPVAVLLPFCPMVESVAAVKAISGGLRRFAASAP